MKLNLQKRLAARVLKIGESRVWIDPNSAEEVSKAITKQDIRNLIRQNIIQEKPKFGISRSRARLLHSQRSKGRRKGLGQRKGTKTARTPAKTAWINKVRPLRRTLKALLNAGAVNSKQYAEIYRKIKGNFFRNVGHLKIYVEKIKA
jgi:large subunit ribosomal protein L19e